MSSTNFKSSGDSIIVLRVGPSLLIVAAFLVACANADTWWVGSKDDAIWTNKPLTEVQAQAQRDDATAEFYYGRAFYFGHGVKSDLTQSLHWTRRAAENGHVDAQFMAARFYGSGTGTTRDPAEALAWASRATAAGHADALALVADAHEFGVGTNRNPAKAFELYNEAIRKGSILALDWLGHFYLKGEGGAARRTNYVEALRCFERAGSNGMIHAASHLVDFYTMGLGAPPNAQRAVFWARYSADQKDRDMMEKLASMYDAGIAEPRGPSDTACELLRRAAGQRASGFEIFGTRGYSKWALNPLLTDLDALCNRYRFGLGTARDFVAVAQWMLVKKRAADWELELRPELDSSDQKRLRVFDQIVQGKLVASSAEDRLLHEAVSLVDRALNRSDPGACRQIGEMYRHGSPLTPQSPVIAWMWLNRATTLKDASAKTALSEVESPLSPEQIELARYRYLPKCNVPP